MTELILEKQHKIELPAINREHTEQTDEMEQVARILVPLMPRYSGALREVGTKLEVLDDEFNMANDHSPIHHMERRIKTPHSIYGKLVKKGFAISEGSICKNILDIAGIRVICKYTNEIYRLSELLSSQTDIELIKCRDYIKEPKDNGYRSLHMVVGVPVFMSNATFNVPVEIQLRTIAMDMWASLEHEIRYKSNKAMKPGMAQKLKQCADELAKTDNCMQSIFLQMMG